MINISYKYRIYPTESQKQFFEKQFGMCRFIYNYCLDLQIKEYSLTQKKIHKYELQKRITQLKKTESYKWLREGHAQALNAETEHLESAYVNFFKTKKGFPKFKSKHNNNKSYTIPQDTKLIDNKLYLPKIKDEVKIKLHRPIIGEIKTCTITKTSTNKYYISINLKVDKDYPKLKLIDESQAVGLDLGIKTFATLSDGTYIDNPKFLKKSLRKLKILSKRHSKKVKGSKNKEKSRLKLALLHEKVTNQRKDFLHKTTKMLVDNYDTICLETLKAKNMMKNHKLAQALSDISIGTFNTMIDYKSKQQGVNILRIGQFEPSSRLCSCGVINQNLTLKDRTWTCSSCNTTHDRDVLASNNIKKFAFIKNNNTVGTTEI